MSVKEARSYVVIVTAEKEKERSSTSHNTLEHISKRTSIVSSLTCAYLFKDIFAWLMNMREKKILASVIEIQNGKLGI